MSCPKWEECKDVDCQEEKTCLNGDYWAAYWKAKSAIPKQERFCYYCKRKFGVLKETIDHIIPRSKGGTNGKNNRIPSCSVCNGTKGDMTLEQFRLYLICQLSNSQRKLSINRLEKMLESVNELIVKISPYRDQLTKKAVAKKPNKAQSAPEVRKPRQYPKRIEELKGLTQDTLQYLISLGIPFHPNPEIFHEKYK